MVRIGFRNLRSGAKGYPNRLLRLLRRRRLSPAQVVSALYRGILDREPDISGVENKLELLACEDGLARVVREFISSPEFHSRFLQTLVPASPLPDLRTLMSDKYEIQHVREAALTVYLARTDTDIKQMALLIDKHRYYDRFGVWTPVIDHDKRITAAILRALGIRNCFELGCFTGPVLSILAEYGIAVLGADVSHLAFAFAYPNVRENMLFGDLLTLDIQERFHAVLCMDVLEHISPLKFDRYLEKLVTLTDEDGYIYLNSPMWGEDRVFGVVEDCYLDEWRSVGETSYWRHWPCDERGWPLHGHLVWASPQWWEQKFHAYGLVRDTIIEAAIQKALLGFFQNAPGRRSLFVLRRVNNRRSSQTAAADISAALGSLLVSLS